MDWQLFTTVFASVFTAELGDKTQLATMVFATRGDSSKWTVFAGAAVALVLTSALGVAAGHLLGGYLDPKALKTVAGLAFVAIGLWTLFAG